MEEVLKKFSSVAENPYSRLTQWKREHNQGIVGCFPMYAPEEIIHAAGLLPVTILGSAEPITLADSYLRPYICALARSNLDMALKGELDFLDGMVFPDICDVAKLTSDIWRRHHPGAFDYTLNIPSRVDSPSSQHYLAQVFAGLGNALQDYTGRRIATDDLSRSISVYNRNRALLSRLYDLRRQNPWLLGAKEVGYVVNSAMLMPKEEHNHWLEELLAKASAASPATDDRVRLVLSGSLCDEVDPGILDLVAEVGAVVADDDLYVGSRYFTRPVDEIGNPIEALAQRHINGVPCATKHNAAADWGDYIVDVVNRAQAQGVVIVTLKFCEPHAFNYPDMKDKLAEGGVPHLLLETEQGRAPLGQMRTRLQAFVESIKF